MGSQCSIGKNVKIVNSIIENGVVVEDGCVLENCVIKSNVKIKAGAQINGGTMVDRGVVVKSGVSVPEGSVSSLLTYDTQEEGFVKSQEVKEDLFETGVISYIPKNMSLV